MKIKLSLLFIILTASVFSQIMGIRVNGGYGLSILKQSEGNRTVYDTNGSLESSSLLTFGQGGGAPVTFELMFNLNPSLYAVIGVGYKFGQRETISYWRDKSIPYLRNVRLESSYLPLLSGVEMSLGDKVRVRAGAGFFTALAGKGKKTETDELSLVWIQEFDITYKPGVGLYSDLGIDFRFNDNFGLGIGIRGMFLTLMKIKETQTKFTIGGEDILDSLTTNDKQILFEDYNPSKDYDSDDVPSWDGPAVSRDFHSLQFLVSIFGYF